MRLNFLLYLLQFMLINIKKVPSKITVIVPYVKNMVVTMLVLGHLLGLKLLAKLWVL